MELHQFLLNVSPNLQNRITHFLVSLVFKEQIKKFHQHSHDAEERLPQELKFFSQLITIEEFSTGEQIIKQGDDSHDIFILKLGKIEGTIMKPNFQRIPILAMLQSRPGTIFGEIAFYLDTERTATITCLTSVSVLSIDYDNRQPFKENCPSIYKGIRRSISNYDDFNINEKKELL